MHPGTLAVAAIVVITGVVSTSSLNLNLKWSQSLFYFNTIKIHQVFCYNKIQLHYNNI